MRGFASLKPEKRRQIARLGGLAVAAKGNGHKWTSEEAKIAGHLGNLSRQSKNGYQAKAME